MKQCRMCGTPLKTPVFVLPNMPVSAQGFVHKKTKTAQTLKLFECPNCSLVQLACKPVSYYQEVIRATAVSDEMKRFRLKQFRQFIKKYHCNKTLEIGSGTGDYLQLLTQVNKNSFGLEANPNHVKACNQVGLQVFKGYLDKETTKIPNAPYDSFIMMNFLEHFPQPITALKAISNNLKNQAYGCIEVPNYDMILKNNLYTELIPDHLLYFTKDTLFLMLNLAGFKVIKIESIFHDYILQAQVKKRTLSSYSSFTAEVTKHKKQIKNLLRRFPNKELAIWGAGHQALTLMSIAGLNDKMIKYVIDSAPFKQNKLTPATFIPIVSPSVLFSSASKQQGPKAILVIAGGYTDEIVRQLKQSGLNLKIFVLSQGVLHEK